MLTATFSPARSGEGAPIPFAVARKPMGETTTVGGGGHLVRQPYDKYAEQYPAYAPRPPPPPSSPKHAQQPAPPCPP